MKRFFATLACTALLSVSISSTMWAQDQPAAGAPEAATEQVEATEAPTPEMEAAQEEVATEEIVAPAEEAGFHQALKTKFIEGGADFMAVIVLSLILGLALCLERIIYLNLCDTDGEKLLKQIEAALAKGNVEEAKNIARNTRGPIASIAYQGLMRMDEGLDVVERSITAYGGVQGGLLEKNLSWITLFIAMAPSLGFLGTVVGMVMAFDKIEQVGDISPTVVAGGMKVALITTIGGLIVALILQLFYNYILSKVEALLNKMEDASISFLDIVIKHNIKNGK